MRLMIATFLLIVATVAIAEDNNAAYDLHEWGVFEAPRNAAWSQMDMKAEWATLPEFFWKSWPTERLPWRGPVRKPVIHIYAEKPCQINLSIKFAEGRPIVWWPAAECPVAGQGKQPTDKLSFALRVGDTFYNAKNPPPAPLPPAVPAGHWIEHLRAVKSSMLYTSGSYGRGGIGGNEPADNFVYYDGLMKSPATPELKRDGNSIVIKSPHAFDMLDVMIIDRNDTASRVSTGWKTIKPGESAKIEMVAAGENKENSKVLETLFVEFVEHLSAAGLSKEEAVSLEKIWHEGFFLRDGMNVIYRVPQETYETWLPLTATPKPQKLVRVGLVCHSHMEPELDAKIDTLIAQLNAETFEERETAQKKLLAIGGAAFPALEKRFADKEPEIANRCRRIVEALDARPALTAKPSE